MTTKSIVAGDERKVEGTVCPDCRNTGWIPYLAELLDGTFEEALLLCHCPKSEGEVPETDNARIVAARKLFEEYGDEIIASYHKGVFQVPSRSRPGLLHAVASRRNLQACSCEDNQINGAKCAHIICAGIAKAKSDTCVECGQRHHQRDLGEVQVGHVYFEGDLLCVTCAERAMVEVA